MSPNTLAVMDKLFQTLGESELTEVLKHVRARVVAMRARRDALDLIAFLPGDKIRARAEFQRKRPLVNVVGTVKSVGSRYLLVDLGVSGQWRVPPSFVEKIA